ncbi:MAG: hypothetical protein PHH84_04350 [Oscillospiraceae bacterium]|nr:hypothetical protein [Oscillospiraceae bacterium]
MNEKIENKTNEEIMRMICTINLTIDLSTVDSAIEKAILFFDCIQKRSAINLYLLRELNALLEKCEEFTPDYKKKYELIQRLNILNERIRRENKIYQEYLHVEA